MGPDCDNGYTRIANELLEALYCIRVPGEAMQILLFIVRKTYGFGKKEDRISLSQFATTGIIKTHIPRALAKLIEMNLITQKGNIYGITYGINKYHESWKALPKKVTITQKGNGITNKGNKVTQKGNEILPKKGTTKEKVLKETIKETITKERGALFEICRAWNGYVEMRNKIKKPMTEYAKELRIKDLVKLQAQGEDPIEVLKQSIKNDWQDLYPVKEKDGRKDDKPKSYRERVNDAAVDGFLKGEY